MTRLRQNCGGRVLLGQELRKARAEAYSLKSDLVWTDAVVKAGAVPGQCVGPRGVLRSARQPHTREIPELPDQLGGGAEGLPRVGASH